MVVFQAWQERFAGISFPTRFLELKCQACGIKVVLYPKVRIRAARLFAYLMIPAIFPSLIFFARARRMERAWIDNPVVEGAVRPRAIGGGAGPALPLDQTGSGPPERRCRCNAAARCVHIALKGSWDFRIGARYDYQCHLCSTRFEVHSIGYLVTVSVLAGVLTALGVLMIVHPPGAAVGAEQSNRWFGVGLALLGAYLWLLFMVRLRGRLAHPVVP